MTASELSYLADRLNDAWAVLRGISPIEMQRICVRQNYDPHGGLDGSLADDMLEAASYIRPEDPCPTPS